ncbi:MAG: DUF554 domain-containing protein [Oscillospiraceae bacterium]|nr:DUF554 domain-containing protein [Oscillospiraceae bacterium]
MIAVVVNTLTVLIGSLIGLLFRSRMKQNLQNALITALGLCTAVIAMMNALKTGDILCIIICMAVGTAVGEALHIEAGIEKSGDALKKRFFAGGNNSRFTEGFVTASILFCIGSMTIVGSLEAGLHHDYSIIYAKSTLDLISSMALASAMGFGVMASALFVLIFQGGLTLLASLAGPVLSEAVVTEMTAVGGTILIGLAVNMIGLGKERIRVANMLPAIFLPTVYVPVSNYISSLFR